MTIQRSTLQTNIIWLVVYLPLWKIWVRQLGWWNSQLNGKIKNVPNHQPVICGWRTPHLYIIFRTGKHGFSTSFSMFPLDQTPNGQAGPPNRRFALDLLIILRMIGRNSSVGMMTLAMEWLVGGIPTPLKNISQLGWLFPNEWKIVIMGWWHSQLNGKIKTGWWCNSHLEKYEFVNGKDYPIYYGQ